MAAQMGLNQLLTKMWQDYCDLNPAAKRIYDLFTAEGETVLNDHIALRTFNHPRLGLKNLAQTFEAYGYKAIKDYRFEEKKLYAKHYEHPDESLPKIFISELLLEHFSPLTQKTVDACVDQLTDAQINSENFCMSGRPWSMSHSLYQELAKESEYASWVSAHGFRPNHFTVNVNAFRKFKNVQSVNEFLKSNGYKLNSSGGEIKGNAKECLEQSSTMAEAVEVPFSDGRFKIPGCYYEFALRYPMQNGKLYTGFVAASADKIFESTNQQR